MIIRSDIIVPRYFYDIFTESTKVFIPSFCSTLSVVVVIVEQIVE